MSLIDRQYVYVRRYHQIVDTLVKHGFGYFVDRFGLRNFRSFREKLFGPKPLKEQMLAFSEAKRLRLALEELGPTFIKFGQILSTRTDLIPGVYIRELEQLQDRVVPFDYSDAKKVIEKELGKKIEDIFSTFNREQIASASIGQVYRATLSEGEEVAVKVMRPGIEDIIEIDLAIMMNMARFVEKHIKESKFFNLVGFVDEFSRIIRLETDYLHEAQNADRFYSNFQGSSIVKIPKMYWEYTTKHVICQEFSEGIRITDIKQLEVAGLDKKKISTDLANAYLKMVFEDNFFHADPHPGNILVSREGKIIFLDFGMAGHIDPLLRENLENLMIAIQLNDIDILVEALSELGLITDVGIEEQALNSKLEELLNKYYSLSSKFINPAAFLKDIIDIFARSRGRIPTNLMLLSKTLMIRDEISRRLDPEHNFGEMTRPYVQKMYEDRKKVSHIIRNAERTAMDFGKLMKYFPRRVNHILTKAEKGTLKLELETLGLEGLIEEMDVTSNRLSFSMIIAALIIGSSLIIQTRMSPSLFGVPLLGIVGFLIAGFLGIGLLISIIRSGKW
ncbi:MAG TPA: AarF/ABC1/UbiB kinase family protein [Candidatus Methylomirabilis sp.]|nr:AarF/ABC1/UbiB kinase family protein [Candidatus Methylomirabilis sp.]